MPINLAVTDVTPSATTLAFITGTEQDGQTLALDESELTGVTSRQWKSDDATIVGQTGATLDTSALTLGSTNISCEIVCNEGTIETPAIYLNSGDMAMGKRLVADLHPHSQSDVVAIADGNWSSTATWNTGVVPAAGDDVLIPFGRTVDYDVGTQVRLSRVRVDGHLKFARTSSTEMLVETLTFTVPSHLDMGTSYVDNIQDGNTCTITISDRHYPTSSTVTTNLDKTTDPTLLGRGIVGTGKHTSYGKQKDTYIKTADNNAPMTSDTSVTLAQSPSGWTVGDRIVIPGTLTTLTGSTINVDDEYRTITGIAGAVISFTGGLSADHDHHNASVTRTDLQPPIINLTKNIIVQGESYNAAGGNTHRNGHMMWMHDECTVDVRDMHVLNMGRTDKSRPAGVLTNNNADFYFTENDGYQTVAATSSSNRQARYPAHFHFTLAHRADPDDVPKLTDCYVENTPGWCYTHHGGHNDFRRCVASGYFGAGMVGETGDETGFWDDCIMFGSVSTSAGDGVVKTQEDPNGIKGDVFQNGYAYGMRGRAIHLTRCIAMGSTLAYAFYHRFDNAAVSQPRPMIRESSSIGDIVFHEDTDSFEWRKHPITWFRGCEAIGTLRGFTVTKENPSQSNSVPAVLRDFRAWAVENGVQVEYIAQYIMLDNDVVGRTGAENGFTMGPNTGNLMLTRPKSEGFTNGIEFILGGINISSDEFNNTNEPMLTIVAHDSSNNTRALQKTDNSGVGTNGIDDVLREYVTEPTYVAPTIGTQFEMFTIAGNGTITAENDTTITDTIGTITAPPTWDTFGLRGNSSGSGTRNRIYDVGYYSYNGGNIVLMPFYYYDRLTGRLGKADRAFIYTGPTSGRPNNGAFTLSTTLPTRADISDTCAKNGSVTIDVLTAATVESGATKSFDPFYQSPFDGHLDFSGNDVIYTPNEDYVGTDKMTVFVSDGRGHRASVEISVTVS